MVRSFLHLQFPALQRVVADAQVTGGLRNVAALLGETDGVAFELFGVDFAFGWHECHRFRGKSS